MNNKNMMSKKQTKTQIINEIFCCDNEYATNWYKMIIIFGTEQMKDKSKYNRIRKKNKY